MLPTLFLVVSSILFASTTSDAAQDFCVANLNGPATPAGFACKAEADVKVDDFVFSGLGVTANTSNLIKAGVSLGFVSQFPGLNGQGISGLRADIAPGGYFPMHSHPDASEYLLILEGEVTAGFISTSNKVYYKTLKQYDSLIAPKGLLHFVVNGADSKAVALAFFNSPNPGVQTSGVAFFGNDLPTELVAKTTFLDPETVKKLKGMLGGSG